MCLLAEAARSGETPISSRIKTPLFITSLSMSKSFESLLIPVITLPSFSIVMSKLSLFIAVILPGKYNTF